MTVNILSSVLSTLPAVQARQISELLSKLQVAGTIRNADEYSQTLQSLSSIVNGESPTPSFAQIIALPWLLCSSEAHNVMMEAAKNDIEAAFLQVNEIGEKLEDHSILFLENILIDLEKTINKQEKNLSRLEWLANKNNEFTNAIVDNFSSYCQTSRTDTNASSLYYDNRTYKSLVSEELPSAIISLEGEKLVLNTEENSIVRPINVKLLSDKYSYQTNRDTSYKTDINNLTDGLTGTYWENNVYLEEPVTKVNTVLDFNLGFGKEVNYMIVEGATSEPFWVESIIGITPDGHRISLFDTSIQVEGKTRIDFVKKNVSSIVVTFSIKSFKKIESYVSSSSSSLSLFDKNLDSIEIKDSLSSIIKESLSSEDLIKICNVPTSSSVQINNYLYSFGLDNVWFGNSLYLDSSIFVSKPLSLINPGIIGVSAKELSDYDLVKNTVEYEIIRIDSSPKYQEIKFPIPRLNQTNVESERFVLYKKTSDSHLNNIGSLRFFPYIDPDLSLSDTDPILLYCNGELLNFRTRDWSFAVSEFSSADSLSLDWNNSFIGFDLDSYSSINLPLKFWIKVNNPVMNAVYTVSYRIQVSNKDLSTTIWLDKDRTTYLGSNGRVYFLQEDTDISVESNIYLQLTLRRNKSSRSSSPEVREYTLLGATY